MDNSNIETTVLATLERLSISYSLIDIDPEFADTMAFCEKYGYPIENSGNTIIVASKTDPPKHAGCLVKASDKLDVNATVRRIMGVRRLSFASSEQTVTLTGMEIGGVTPFALPDQVPIYVDAKIMKLDYVILGSGSRKSKLKINPGSIMQIPNTRVISGLSIQVS